MLLLDLVHNIVYVTRRLFACCLNVVDFGPHRQLGINLISCQTKVKQQITFFGSDRKKTECVLCVCMCVCLSV